MSRKVSPTRLTIGAASLQYCLTWAYDLPFYRIVAPDWATSPQAVRYDIAATVDSPATEDEMKVMLRELLAERLGLVVHREQREVSVYGLFVEKAGLKMHAAEKGTPEEFKPDGPYRYRARNTSISTLIGMLEPPFTSRPVIDMTGLHGGFNFELNLSSQVTDPQTGQPAVDSSGHLDWESALLATLPKQLGLVLKPQHASMDMLVVDSANKDPIN